MPVEYRKYRVDDYDFVYQLKRECYYPYGLKYAREIARA